VADDAIRAVQQAIENARREGRTEGFAAALQAMRDFLSSVDLTGAPQPQVSRVKPRPGSVPKGRVGEPNERYVPRIPRGVPDHLVSEAFKSIAPRAAGPTEIQHAIRRGGDGPDIPFTTMRRAIDRLVASRKLEIIEDTKTWRWIGDVGQEDGGVVRPIRQTR
jgi:hypothetical protein